ncbi:cytochrome P450 [Phycicoccus ginsengisoli]
MPTKSSLDAADLLDLGDPAVVADPYPAMAALREQAPIAWHSRMGTWLATGHAEAGAVLRDRRLGRVFGPRTPEDDWDTFNWLHADSILDSEPPKHTRLRRLVAGAFGRGHVQRLAPRIEELAAGLLAQLPDSGPFDVIEQYAEPLPVLVIAELLGVPEADRHHLRPWSQAIVRMYEVDRTPAEEQAAREAAAAFAAYVEELATDRAKAPGEDLLSDLVQARDGSDRLSAHELVATAVLLLNAGHEASVNGFGNGLHSWLTAPDQPQVDVRDEAALEQLVEELLRHDSPLHLFERTAKEPASVAGIELEPGDKVAALLGAANRDPKVFADPDRFDPTRDPNPHLAFGAGIHFCIGAPLARLELAISVRTLLGRHPGLELVEAVQRPTFVLRGFERLVVSPVA